MTSNLKEKVVEGFVTLNAFTSIILLILIFLFIGFVGIQFFSEISPEKFFLVLEWNPGAHEEPTWGVISLVMGTIFIAIGALSFSLPLGIASAIYLSKLSSEKTKSILKPFIEMIAAIPSVVLGLFGLVFLAPLVARIFGLPSGLNALTASLLVGFIALPTIISISEDAISSVPKKYENASLSLGATKWETIKKVTLPSANSGIIAAVMLGFGRIVGETMVVLMVAGNARAFPTSFLDPVRPMTANIAIEAMEVVQGSVHYQGLFAIGLLLFFITFGVNTIADWIIQRGVKAE